MWNDINLTSSCLYATRRVTAALLKHLLGTGHIMGLTHHFSATLIFGHADFSLHCADNTTSIRRGK